MVMPAHQNRRQGWCYRRRRGDRRRI